MFQLPIISPQSKSAPLTAKALIGIPPVFPSLRDHSAVMSIVQCLKRIAEYIFFSSFIVVHSGRASPVAVTPSLSKGMFLHKLQNLHVHLGGCQVVSLELKNQIAFGFFFFYSSRDKTMSGSEISRQFLEARKKSILRHQLSLCIGSRLQARESWWCLRYSEMV